MSQPDVLGINSGFQRFACLLALWAMIGCGHTEPFGARTFDTDQPFDPTPPVQLTLNQGPDRRASWLPDGSGFLYSTQQVDTRDGDVCLAELPATGGRQRARICTLSIHGGELTESLESAAAFPDGRLAYIAASSAIGTIGPDIEALVLASVDDPVTRTSLVSIPYTIPGRRTHKGISQIHWLSSSRLVYLGEAVSVFTPCQFCQMDTLRSGLDVVLLDLGEASVSPRAVPGTDNASGVSPGSTGDDVYYTLGGDTRVYRQTLSTGEVTAVHDFGAAGIARDVDVVGQRMTAAVGGRVHFAADPSLGSTQWDSGGIVHVVNLQDGSDVPLSGLGDLELFRRPRLSPGGTEIVAERYPLNLVEVRDAEGFLIRVDTLVARTADLYLFGRP
jgi:hypothetical protein